MSRAVVLFSGGQDSTTCLAWAKNRFEEVYPISMYYGQTHKVELEQGALICKILGFNRQMVDISFLPGLVNSGLVGDMDLSATVAHPDHLDLPSSWVPNRNSLLLTIAHAYAQKVKAGTVVAGVCMTDYSGYPDCRREFIDHLEETLNIGNDTKIRIETPLMYLTKAETFKLAQDEKILSLVLEHSNTCYRGDRQNRHPWGYGCGTCAACQLREKGWNEFQRMT